MNLLRSMLFANSIGSACRGFLTSRRLVAAGILGSVLFGATPFNDGLLAAEKPLATTAASKNVGYREIVAPFFKQHCVRCHGELKQEGEFHLERHLKTNFLDPSAKEKWGEVVNVLNSHEMPPEKEPQPKPNEVAKVVDWITEQLARAEVIRRDGQIVLRRLNRDEYRNTICDLTGVDLDVSSFPQEPTAGGFDNNGKALTMSPMHTELYLDAARKVLDRALEEGDQPPSRRSPR